MVNISIRLIEKLLNDEPIEYASYYIAGSLVIDMPDIRSDKTCVLLDVRDITTLEPGDDCRQQYLISKMYLKIKNPNCSLYSLAETNIKIFENT